MVGDRGNSELLNGHQSRHTLLGCLRWVVSLSTVVHRIGVGIEGFHWWGEELERCIKCLSQFSLALFHQRLDQLVV